MDMVCVVFIDDLFNGVEYVVVEYVGFSIGGRDCESDVDWV